MRAADVQPWLDNWLSGQSRRWHLRFARNLETAYEHDTGADRGHMLSLLAIIACMAFLAWDAGGGLSGIPVRIRLNHAAVTLPVFLAMAFAFDRGLPAWARETLAGALIVGSSVSLTVLYAIGAWPSAALSTVGVTMAMLLSAQLAQLRFPFAAPAIAAMATAQAAALAVRHPIGVESVGEYACTLAIAAAIAIATTWRQERDNRRTYLVGLRDRLSRRDLTIQARELDDLTRRDPLTGLPNRRAFDDWLRTPIADATAARLVSMIAIDIDHFKSFNDFYGHPAGDHCLRTVANRLREEAREQTDLLARIGGEEFAILLVGGSSNDATALAERLRAAVAALNLPHARGGGRVTISAGVAHAFVLDSIPLETLAKQADEALYDAKESGRNRVRMAGDGKPGAAAPDHEAGPRALHDATRAANPDH